MIKVPIRELWGIFRKTNYYEIEKLPQVRYGVITSYNMNELESDLKKNGLKKPIKCSYMDIDNKAYYNVQNTSEYLIIHKNFKYKVLDGNHRIHVLKKLYGEDYKVKIQIEIVNNKYINKTQINKNNNMRRLIYDMYYNDEITQDVAAKLLDKLEQIKDKKRY